ncbi:MAG: hypothetical protein HY265_00455 [Deltaproteobacteria bacterium]|nr:hypothetical protein [Deltaproteobacteria bacterium]
MSKLIAPIIITVIIVVGIGAFSILQKPAFPEPRTNKLCGDGICDANEKANPNLCPQDCQGQTTAQQKNQPTATPTTSQTQPPSGLSIPATPSAPLSSAKDSPFGMHPAHISMQDSTYKEAKDIGVKWHRPSMYMVWSAVQKDLNSQNYNFTAFDKYYGGVQSGINILANITSRMKQESEYTLANSFLPTDEQKYLNFVKAVVERYDGDGIDDMQGLKNPILYWQVGNEPNNKGGVKDFAKLQKITYQAIKEVCPQCKVLIGGAAQPIDTLGLKTLGFVSKTDDYFYEFGKSYESYLKELNGEGFDIFDFHWYGEADGDYRKLGAVYEQIKILLKKYGFGNAPVWITEMGAYSGEPSDKSPKGEKLFSYQTETQQAADYLKRFVYPLSLGIEKIFPAFGLIEGFKGNDGYFDHTGFIYEGKGSNDLGYGVKKLSYYTYKKMVEILEGSDWNNIQTIQESDGVYVYKFQKGGKKIWVAWNDNPAEKQITITGIGAQQVKITEAVPKYESGKDVTDYSTAFNTETKSASNGKITITLKDKPVFVEEK